MSPEELARWQAFRRECGQPWRKKHRAGKLLRIFDTYVLAGSVKKTSRMAKCGEDTVRAAVKYVQTKQALEVQGIAYYIGMLEAQGVA